MKRLAAIDLKQLLFATRSYVLLSLGALVLAVNFNIFLAPHNIAPGGVSGTTLMLVQYTGWPEGLTMLALQSVMIVIGFRYLGRFQFLMRTLYVSLLYSLSVDVLQPWLPPDGITDDLLLNTIYGGLVGGIGLGLVFWGGGNAAGTSIISRVVQLKTGIPTSQIYIFVDGGVILMQGLVFGWDKALYGLMMLIVWGMATDYVQEGPSVIRTVIIITDRPEPVTTVLFERLHVGVTAWAGTGMFTRAERVVLFCTINRSDFGTLKRIVAEADPLAFTVVGQGHQAFGGVLRGANGPALAPKVQSRQTPAPP